MVAGRSHMRRRGHAQAALHRPRITVRGILLTMGAAGLALVSTSHSLAQLTERNLLTELGPIGKHQNGALVPVVSRMAQQRGLGSPDRALALSRETVTVAPLNPAAVRTAGLAFAEIGREAQARRAMETAIALSRREGVAHLWLINEAVERREISDILVHYDAVMRTLPAGARPLQLNLARTLAAPQMRREMSRHVSADTPWFESFAAVAVEKTSTAIGFARLLDESRAVPDSSDLREVYAAVVTTLAQQRQFALLERLYPRLPGSRAVDLTTMTLPAPRATPYPPANWLLQAGGSYGGSSVGSGNEAAMELYAASGAGGVAASKLLILNPGRYAVSWRMIEAPEAADAAARLQVRCASDDDERQIAEVAMPEPRRVEASVAGSRQGRSARVIFDVLRDCAALFVDMRVSGGTDRDESRWLIDRLSVQRLSANGAARNAATVQ